MQGYFQSVHMQNFMLHRLQEPLHTNVADRWISWSPANPSK